ncbi:MAG TPA: hypothetical protein VK789_23495 [Bryobacteraceae bacterium]|nr:hypothetical protein [Bryobacteraceae bacterium]
MEPAAVAYDCGVGARVIRKPDSSARKKKETVTLWAIFLAVGFPLLLAYILVAVDMRSDLSELKPSKQVDDEGFVPVGWPELETQSPQGPVRMIGYMMDGYRPSSDGAPVDMFILLPEAGQFLHPAHRIPNQMVEVRPKHPMPFKSRQLVWVSGKLDRTFGKPGEETAAWAIGEADVRPAQPQEISKWFQP